MKVVCRLFPEFKLEWLMEETKQNLPNELSFLHEAGNQERVRCMLAHLQFLKVVFLIYRKYVIELNALNQAKHS